MDTNNWRPTSGQGPVGGIGGGGGVGEPTMDAGDWRTELQPDARQRIVSKIMETLKRNLPVSGQEGLQELRKMAIRFEEKTFTAATSQGDYLRKMSLKLLPMETKSQNPPANSLPSNSAGNGNRPPDLGGIGGGGGVGEPTMDAGDWRTELQPDARQRIVSKIMDTLKRHLPVSSQEGLQELREMAISFEEKTFTAATSQGDYLRKISLKMLPMETKSQNPPANSLPSNSAGNGNRPPDLGKTIKD
ncbi:hypothetical protein I3760_02G159600 [Carya illinoinensis]|uniref:Mediator complex subunit 15 KIX domain-containing protein n=1 Tax=Carya illinoinensis TaxID=32201 RepID=A0A922FTH1_CARIL|nr:hypothetical protein I3760_02G159600 [Carya illinoinensis]KAG6728114.1 hypothetical protein I3842_02G157000 [Carya illinoinensis]